MFAGRASVASLIFLCVCVAHLCLASAATAFRISLLPGFFVQQKSRTPDRIAASHPHFGLLLSDPQTDGQYWSQLNEFVDQLNREQRRTVKLVYLVRRRPQQQQQQQNM